MTFIVTVSMATSVSSPRFATYSSDSSADNALPSGVGPGVMAMGAEVGSLGLILVTVLDDRFSA